MASVIAEVLFLPLALLVAGAGGPESDTPPAVASADYEDPVTVAGLWVNHFEDQRLVVGADDPAQLGRGELGEHIWFEAGRDTIWDVPPPDGYWRSGVYRITVSGRYARRTSARWATGFGHLGMSDGAFRADHIRSVEYLGAYPADD